ncbi:MAG TPA: hypothetical protein VIG32_04830 [Candidatus Baltobacteraceae bacterium]
MDWVAALLRWFHDLAGIVWIGLHYYLDFVHPRARAAAMGIGRSALIDELVLPRVGFYLRCSAIIAWLLGCAMLVTLTVPGRNGFTDAFLLRGLYAPIGIGAWLGTIMLLVALVPMRSQDERTAFLWTRVNTMLSIPMIFFMAFGFSHQGIVGL